MKDIVFASDLDNTLLHSLRRRREGDICVERNNGREQGFMTPGTIRLLEEAGKTLTLIPVTTRSIEQYRRIEWPHGTEPEYAVTTNGAVLLRRGRIDEAWRRNQEARIAPCREELLAQYEKQSKKEAYIRCRLVDESYLFAYCADGVAVEETAEECRRETLLTVQHSGRKIYFFPPGLDKGLAVKMLRERFPGKRIYAAGDSCIDVPLLREADLAFAHRELESAKLDEAAHIRRQEGEGNFAEWLLEQLLLPMP